jgi:hypothetical protein
LENHWNGSLLDTVDTALNSAQTMTWNGQHPVVTILSAKSDPVSSLPRQAAMPRRAGCHFRVRKDEGI